RGDTHRHDRRQRRTGRRCAGEPEGGRPEPVAGLRLDDVEDVDDELCCLVVVAGGEDPGELAGTVFDDPAQLVDPPHSQDGTPGGEFRLEFVADGRCEVVHTQSSITSYCTGTRLHRIASVPSTLKS